MNQFSRNNALIGIDGQKKLNDSHVLIVGIGGVGGYVLEMLARCGVGEFTVVDMDSVDVTNINRQIIALHSTVDKYKTEVACERVKDINPEVKITALCQRFSVENSSEIFNNKKFDYCADAIDSVKDKIELISACNSNNVPSISAMGAGNRMDVCFAVKDVFSTSYDGLAKAVRSGLRKIGIQKHKCVCADSPTQISAAPPASIAYAPALMGCIMAQEIIKDLLCR